MEDNTDNTHPRNPKNNRFISTYEDEVKERAVQVFLITGSATKTSQICKVPYRTLMEWKKSNWWEDKFEEARIRYRKQLDGKFNAMFGYIVKELEQRLRKGDEVILKDGTKVYRKLSGSELSSIAERLWKILALLRGEPTSRTEKVTITEYLDNLQDDLKRRTQEKKKKEKEEENVKFH